MIQPRLKVGEPDDRFEKEAERVADAITKIPEMLQSDDPVGTSTSACPSLDVEPHGIECAGGPARYSPRIHKGKPDIKTSITKADTFIQRQTGVANKQNQTSVQQDKKQKAELEFHSALHFNRTFHGFNPTGEPKGGEYAIIWWSVWNTGFETAPEHTNRLTVYRADLCSGCRNENDQILLYDFPAPSVVSITQQGKSEYENAVLIPMAFSVGHYDVYVELDIRNEVDEINEDNNTSFMSFYVKPNNEPESGLSEDEETVRPMTDGRPPSNIGPDLEAEVNAVRDGGQPLPLSLRAFFEPRFGYDFSQVRVHTDENAQTSARKINALAYTIGNHIALGSGQLDSSTREGRRLLAHELTHVIQQSKGPCSGGHFDQPAIKREPARTPVSYLDPLSRQSLRG
jgi:hypothetical protein